MTKNEIHLSKRKKKQGETKDDVCDIGNDPISCLTQKDTNGIESRINRITTIEYLLSCIECEHQTPYAYLWFAVQDGREHVLTSEHKQVTITEINWQNEKALEILRIDIKSSAEQ
jgi:hypothetical protein